MSFHKPTRLQLAVHEAGHAYAFAAVAPSEHPMEMALCTDDAGNARGWSKRKTLLKFGTSLVNKAQSRNREAAAEVFITVAGPLAEFRHRHRSRDAAAFVMQTNVDRFLMPDAFDTEGDFEHIRAVLDCIGSIDPRATLRASIDAADFSLAQNWPAIKRLSRVLSDRSRLDEDELSAWFAKHPAKPCPIALSVLT